MILRNLSRCWVHICPSRNPMTVCSYSHLPVLQLFNAMISKVPVLIKMGQMASQASQKRQRDPQPLLGSADAEGGGQTAPFFETVWDKKKVDGLVESICLSMVTASRDEDRDRILSHISQHFDDFAVEETIRNAIWVGLCDHIMPAPVY